MAETEKEFKSWVIDAARLTGWRYAHFLMAKTKRGWRTPQEGDLGFPDMVLLKPPRLILAELKVPPNRPSDGQQEWLAQLDRVPGVESYLWMPADRERILDTLRGLQEAPA